jgi:hypothetical protein
MEDVLINTIGITTIEGVSPDCCFCAYTFMHRLETGNYSNTKKLRKNLG